MLEREVAIYEMNEFNDARDIIIFFAFFAGAMKPTEAGVCRRLARHMLPLASTDFFQIMNQPLELNQRHFAQHVRY